ncbi:MAG: bifunctional folylpolyglutamate synthase/dihydrofolate synthase, partial [Thermomicrobiales bacterium]|nr:bifunctional folylpolyglutamate synthase/dihydrofolate synthase [Thermomicrobiales bacterium]
ILHVAGSKGKGSTCAFAAGLLTEGGLRTGLYSSPHLHSYRERFRIDGELIPEPDFATTWEQVRTETAELERRCDELGAMTAFEMVTAMAFVYFAGAGCDAAVIEVGLGGTLDATNIVAPDSTAIAALDYEHTRVLGSTMAEIAANKAGIIKPGVPLATAAMPDEALAVVASVVAANAAPWLLAGRDWTRAGTWREFAATGPWGTFASLHSGLIGEHQADNACLAIAAVWSMLEGALTESIARQGLSRVSWPGRFEIARGPGGGDVVLDGAHTPAAAIALAATYATEFTGSRAIVVLGLLRDKDPLPIARALLPIASRFIAITPPGPRGLPASELATAIDTLGLAVQSVPDVNDALDRLGGDPAIVTGSLTTVAAAREALGLAQPDPIVT